MGTSVTTTRISDVPPTQSGQNVKFASAAATRQLEPAIVIAVTPVASCDIWWR